jgi:hypothetical protein
MGAGSFSAPVAHAASSRRRSRCRNCRISSSRTRDHRCARAASKWRCNNVDAAASSSGRYHRRACAASQWRRNDFDVPICSIDGLQPCFRRQWRCNDFDAPICSIDGLQPRFRPVVPPDGAHGPTLTAISTARGIRER